MKDLTQIELPILTDGRLVVRPYRLDDAPAVAAFCDDETMQRWIPLPVPYTLADAEEWVGGAEARWRDEAWATFVICDTGERALGAIGVHVSRPLASGEIGYNIAREARGAGVAAGAVRILTGWCFGELELGRLQIRVHPDNVASRRTAQAAGFRYEGLLRRENLMRDEREDSVVYSLLPDEPPAPRELLGWPHLEDGRLVVRPFAPGDAAAVQAACDDPDVARWIHLVPSPYSLADAEAFVADSLQRLLVGQRARLAIAAAGSGELLGSISLDLFAERQAAEIGYWVKREARRRGVALAAARLVLHWAFQDLGVERLEILTYPGNAASQALAEKLGFRRECLQRGFLAIEPGKSREGRVVPSEDGSLPARDDQVQFVLLREAWEGAH